MDLSHIRNFSIIAHIATANRRWPTGFIEKCELVERRNHVEQMLDNMDLERERGITIKSNTVTLKLPFEERPVYVFNLIDTRGTWTSPTRFRARSPPATACSSSSDASQGVEAQTIANPLPGARERPGDSARHPQDRHAQRRRGATKKASANRWGSIPTCRPGLRQRRHRHR